MSGDGFGDVEKNATTEICLPECLHVYIPVSVLIFSIMSAITIYCNSLFSLILRNVILQRSYFFKNFDRKKNHLLEILCKIMLYLIRNKKVFDRTVGAFVAVSNIYLTKDRKHESQNL